MIRGSKRQPARGRAVLASLASALLLSAVAACQSSSQDGGAIRVEAVDSVLSELGGSITADLDRGRRWRMISSIGPGLPPADYQAESLPEPGSRGAGLLQVYCVQCHWLPTPQMHSALEWPILVRRNLFRARSLKDRLGGPLTEGLIGEVLMAGLQSAELPSPAEVDTLLAYLERNALQTASPDELPDQPGKELLIGRCSICHETPSPRSHTAAGWDQVVVRMQANMIKAGVETLTDAELDEITAYLRAESGGGRAGAN